MISQCLRYLFNLASLKDTPLTIDKEFVRVEWLKIEDWEIQR